MGWIAVMVLTSTPALANSELVVNAEPVRGWPLPAGFSPQDALVDASVDGVTLMLKESGGGDEAAQDCLVVVADEAGAQSYDYRHQFSTSTRCIDAVAHPQGGFFVRGEVVEDVGEENDEVAEGFTARIASDGELLWATDDADWLDDPGFSGNYGGAIRGLAYDRSADYLIGLSLGVQVLPDSEHPVVQAHIVDGETGSVEVAGQGFGALARDPVLDMVARDGEFLVHTRDDDNDEPRFYSYEVGRSMTQFEPETADWSNRELVVPIAHRDSLGTFYLWREGEGPTPSRGVVRAEGLDSVVWSEEYSAAELIDEVDDGAIEAEQIWVGESLLAIRYSASSPNQEDFLQFVDVDDGLTAAVASWTELGDFEALQVSRTTEGELRLIVADPTDGQIWEYDLELGAADSNDDTDEPDRDGSDDGSSCSTTGGAPTSLALAVFAFLFWSSRARRPLPQRILRSPI